MVGVKMPKQIVYTNPPIKEVTCWIEVVSDMPINDAFLKKFHSKIIDTYPDYNVGKRIPPECLECDKAPENADTYEYENKLTKSMVVIDGDKLTIKLAGEYRSGEKCLDEIHKIYEAYSSLRTINQISNIMLRYLNKIIIIARKLKIEDYFTIYPNVNGTIVNFILGYDIENKEDHLRSRLTFMPTLSKDENASAFILEVKVHPSRNVKVSPEIDAIDTWFEKSHESIKNMFESAITDKTRDIFKEVSK